MPVLYSQRSIFSIPSQFLVRLSGKAKESKSYYELNGTKANDGTAKTPAHSEWGKHDLKPPERPPKRPHLKAVVNGDISSPSSPSESQYAPPPPLLPRAPLNQTPKPKHQSSFHHHHHPYPHHQQQRSQQKPKPPIHQQKPQVDVQLRKSPQHQPDTVLNVAPCMAVDENNVEDAELKRIEESAKELQNLNPALSNKTLAINESKLHQLQSSSPRSFTPDLPLPPPPPRTEDEEVVVNDDPLPPPPTPTEVNGLADGNGRARNTGSPPLAYPKNSYMSYRSERQPGRNGFDGNYHRNSPVNSECSSPTPPPMEGTNTSLTPTAWERWHNIRPTGTTVVFQSKNVGIKPSFALSETELQEKEEKQGQKGETGKNGLTATKKPTMEYRSPYRIQVPSFRGYSTDVSPVSSNNNQCSPTTPTSPQHTSPLRKTGPLTNLRTSLESLTAAPNPIEIQNSRDSKSVPYRRISTDNLPPSLSSSSLRLNGSSMQTDQETNMKHRTSLQNKTLSLEKLQSENEQQSSETNKPFCMKRTNSATQTIGENEQRHVEVMTQTTPSISKFGRHLCQEELECEQLTKRLASQLPEEDKALQQLLVPGPRLKTTADYMEGLFEIKVDVEKSNHPISPSTGNKTGTSSSSEEVNKSPEAQLPANSAYFTTSESKAKFLTRYSKDMKKSDVYDMKDSEVGKKKEELTSSISRKLDILRMEQLAIKEEINSNEELGRNVTERVEQLAKANEFDKYKLHVEEIDKITNLLLGLSGRLARAENALMNFPKDSNLEERQTLEAKRDKLMDQHEEAKKLKESIDRRSQQVSEILHKYLSSEEYADYDHFIKMKSKLLMDSREISEKIKLGEEQMNALKESLGKQH